jgi:hypothetical protein
LVSQVLAWIPAPDQNRSEAQGTQVPSDGSRVNSSPQAAALVTVAQLFALLSQMLTAQTLEVMPETEKK